MISAFATPMATGRLTQEGHLCHIYISNPLPFILTFFSTERVFLLDAFMEPTESRPLLMQRLVVSPPTSPGSLVRQSPQDRVPQPAMLSQNSVPLEKRRGGGFN